MIKRLMSLLIALMLAFTPLASAAQNPINVPDGSGYSVRTGINNALQTLATLCSGPTQPNPIYPYMWWVDTGNNQIKQANAAATAFDVMGTLNADGTINWYSAPAGLSNVFAGDYNAQVTTGFYASSTIGQSNAPSAAYRYYLLVQAINSTTIYQQACDVTTGTVWTRTQVSGTWSAWSQNVTTANLPPTYRNRLINGEMLFDQWHSGGAFAAANNYAVDRWQIGGAGGAVGKVNTQQVALSSLPGFTNALAVVVPTAYTTFAAGDCLYLTQKIEGVNIRDLNFGMASAQPVTLQFWVFSPMQGTFSAGIINGGVNRSYNFTYSVTTANAWTKVSVTIPGDVAGTWLTNTGIGMWVVIDLGAGASWSTATTNTWQAADYTKVSGTSSIAANSGTWYFTGFQLEKGAVATPYEYRPYSVELSLCQRYYCVVNGNVGYNNTGSTVPVAISARWPVPLRASPTTTIANGTLCFTDCYEATGYINVAPGTWANPGAFTANAEL